MRFFAIYHNMLEMGIFLFLVFGAAFISQFNPLYELDVILALLLYNDIALFWNEREAMKGGEKDENI